MRKAVYYRREVFGPTTRDGMRGINMATLQVREIDDGLYQALKSHAARQHRSLSQQVVRILESNLPDSKHSAVDATEEFLKLSGSWHDDRTAGQIAKEIRSHRKNSARFGADHVVFD
jgi:plasmid stability protein